MSRWPSAVAAVAVVLTVLLGHRQLLQPVALTTRDHTDFYLRVQQYHQELADGHWPQNFPNAVRGGGHAFPLFYPPLSHATAVAAYRFTGDVISATHYAALAAAALAGLACFLVLRSLTGGVLPAAVAGAAYAILPYPYVALDIRGAFAETWALVFFPLVLLGFVRSFERVSPPRWLPFAMAGMMASHLVMSAWTLPVLLVLSLFSTRPKLTSSRVLSIGGACLIAAGLVAPFVVPSLMGLSGVRAADPELMRATPEAIAGVSWPFYSGVFGTFPYWRHLQAMLFGIGLLGLVQSWRKPDPVRRLCWAAVVMYALLSALVEAPVAVWRLVPQQLRYIQFPQRLLGPASLCLVIAAAIAISWLPSRRRAVLLTPVGVLIILYAWSLGGMVLPRSGENGTAVIARLATAYPDRGLTVVGEYLPREAEPERLAAAIQQTLDGVGREPLLDWRREPRRFAAQVAVSERTEVPLPLVRYDFYDVIVEGRPAVTGSREGQLTVLLEPGTHQVVVTRRWPAGLQLGIGIGLASWLVLGLGLFRRAAPLVPVGPPVRSR